MAGKDIIAMTQGELKRLHVIRKALDKLITQAEAAGIIGICLRQAQRIVRAVKVEGNKGVILKGSDRIDQPRLKAIVGKWRVVDSDTLEKELEFVTGTICPLDLNIPIIIDK